MEIVGFFILPVSGTVVDVLLKENLTAPTAPDVGGFGLLKVAVIPCYFCPVQKRVLGGNQIHGAEKKSSG